ncbi:MAG: branched-chain amino acid ABC transporter permease [Peptococcaceae bacterium]|jgi:branched-chain amino acid transport system permease protein|nr:branched-chain amino acid ABC transporter permease [Peptococcaceae bacterium]
MLSFISPYYQSVAILAMINAVSAVGLAVFTGFTGLMSLGHAAFIAVGAYSCAIATKIYGLPFAVGLLLAGLIAGLTSLVIGIPTLRAKLRSDYFTIATLGFGEAIRVLLENLSITSGARGMPGLAHYSTLLPTFIVLALVVFFTRNFIFFRYGRMAVAIREDHIAAEMAGINLFKVRLRSLFFSAVCAGVGGALMAHHVRFIQPNMFTNVQSTLLTATVVAGGMGSITGPIIAAVIFAIVPEVLRVAEMWRLVAYGAILVAIMVLRPQGIMGYREISLSGMIRFCRRLVGTGPGSKGGTAP